MRKSTIEYIINAQQDLMNEVVEMDGMKPEDAYEYYDDRLQTLTKDK